MELLGNLGDGFAIAITWQNLLLALLALTRAFRAAIA